MEALRGKLTNWPGRARLRHAYNLMAEQAGFLLNSYAEVFFLKSAAAGGLLLALTLSSGDVGLSGLLSVAVVYWFARLIGMEQRFLASGFYTYNALLVGLSIGYLFALGPLTAFLVASAGIFSFVVSVAAGQVFSYYLKLPILSLPFVVVSSISWLASQGYGALYVNGVQGHVSPFVTALPLSVEGFFTALGAVLFIPDPLAGMLVALLIGLHSRILLLLAVFGFYLGATLSGLLAGDPGGAYTDVNNFNFILIAMALGGVFLIPSPRSYLIAVAAVAVATLVLSAVRLFWANVGIPAFTLPFNLVTLTFVYVLGVVGFPLVALRPGASPEATLDDYLSRRQRFGPELRRLNLPFAGQWRVWQGFDGPWTHQGNWRYAYDFVISRDGRTYRGAGKNLDDYYAWRKPVLAPCRGRVVRVVSGVDDNPPGHIDPHHNWGNLVIIETPEGDWVELSHFARHSLRVQEGQWVEPGTPLGLCGNSGNSAQPHIHLQVQRSAEVGAATEPFQFVGYLLNGQFQHNGQPAVDDCVEPLFPDAQLELRFALPLDTRIRFHEQRDGQPGTSGLWQVRMNPLGETYLDSGHGRLFFARDSHSFYFYRLEGEDRQLALAFAAVPRLPLSYRQGMGWSDAPPLAVTTHGTRRHLLNLLRAFSHGVGRSAYQARWDEPGRGSGTLQRPAAASAAVTFTLAPRLGFSRIRLGGHTLELELLS